MTEDIPCIFRTEDHTMKLQASCLGLSLELTVNKEAIVLFFSNNLSRSQSEGLQFVEQTVNALKSLRKDMGLDEFTENHHSPGHWDITSTYNLNNPTKVKYYLDIDGSITIGGVKISIEDKIRKLEILLSIEDLTSFAQVLCGYFHQPYPIPCFKATTKNTLAGVKLV